MTPPKRSENGQRPGPKPLALLARRIMSLDSCEDMFTRRRVPVFLLHMGDQRIRELVAIAAREAPLAAWGPPEEYRSFVARTVRATILAS